MKIDRMLLIISLILLTVTLSLTALSFHAANFALRVQTMLYATFIFISGAAILALIQIVHLTSRGASRYDPEDGKR